jgi:hypothetical protein
MGTNHFGSAKADVAAPEFLWPLSGDASDLPNDRDEGAKLTGSFRALHWQLLSKADVHGSGPERRGLGRELPLSLG